MSFSWKKVVSVWRINHRFLETKRLLTIRDATLCKTATSLSATSRERFHFVTTQTTTATSNQISPFSEAGTIKSLGFFSFFHFVRIEERRNKGCWAAGGFDPARQLIGSLSAGESGEERRARNRRSTQTCKGLRTVEAQTRPDPLAK